MAISSVGIASNPQLQALLVVRAMERSAAANPDADPSTIPTTAAGLKISGRTAASLTDLAAPEPVKLGYSHDEAKAFQMMIDSARDYLKSLQDLSAKDPTTLTAEEKVLTVLYPPAAIDSMNDKLDGVIAAYNNKELTFKTFATTAQGDVSISAKVIDKSFKGTERTLLDFSFTQAKTEDKKNYAAVWSVDGDALMQVRPGRIL